MEPQEATVLVAGATGRTGREVLDVLLDAGIEVRALTTTPGSVGTLELQGADEVVVGDLLDRGDAERAVAGVDAVLCAVGSSFRDLLGGPLVDGEGTVNLVAADDDAGVERFALVSSIGVGDSRTGMPGRSGRRWTSSGSSRPRSAPKGDSERRNCRTRSSGLVG